MEITKVINQLNSVVTRQPHCEWKLFVRTLKPGTVGGTPCVEVKQMDVGIDWDKGKVIIDVEMPLTTLSPEDVAAIRESVKKGQSWHAYQSHIKHTEKIKALEAEVKRLTALTSNN